ncbi:sigma factor [Breoghania sp.]|uniref:sigma factor n=1 Tax=Breoghania sp. TaxID=2065378 RepID=UPI0026113C79|nr:sigma factor [Breoghania sp.]MDJ0930594.1 sigma factor [Breoghania sp.]
MGTEADRDRLLAVFSHYEARLKRYFADRTRLQADAEDLTQEAWIKLSRNGASALAAPSPYLMRIARTLAINHERTRRRRLSEAEVDDLLAVPDTAPRAGGAPCRPRRAAHPVRRHERTA